MQIIKKWRTPIPPGYELLKHVEPTAERPAANQQVSREEESRERAGGDIIRTRWYRATIWATRQINFTLTTEGGQ